MACHHFAEGAYVCRNNISGLQTLEIKTNQRLEGNLTHDRLFYRHWHPLVNFKRLVRNVCLRQSHQLNLHTEMRQKTKSLLGGSLSGAIPDGKIPKDVFVCVLTGSLCNM